MNTAARLPVWRPGQRLGRALLAATLLAVDACSGAYPARPMRPDQVAQLSTAGLFVLGDGARLPYRQWLPDHPPAIVALALHGFNDSADAWELPAPVMAAHGIAVIAPDQRGFGAAPERGRWPGAERMVLDAAEMARQLQARFPHARLFLLGESMGGAVLMRLASEPDAPKVAGYVFSAPAVWGRRQMNLLLRGTLWITNSVAPGMFLASGPFRVRASDNQAALVRLSTDPRTLTRTRVAAVKGLVDLMTDAQRAAPAIRAPALFLYGGHDELVPRRATAAAWHRLPLRPGGDLRVAFYPNGYHLLLRDVGREAPIEDMIAWMHNPAAPLPSGAEAVAHAWLAHEPAPRTPPLPPAAKPR